MKQHPDPAELLEPERYELDAGPAYRFEWSRRRFVQLFGGGIAVGFVLPSALARPQESGRFRDRPAVPQEVSAWLHIAEDGAVTVYTGKVEVGQNIRTSLAQAVAEELRVPLETISMVMGDTDRVPYDRGTFGSQSTPRMGTQLRKVSAAARELLLDLAAERWKVDRGGLRTAAGKVADPRSGRAAGYGELTRGQKLLATVGEDQPLTPATAWKVAGHAASKVDGRAFVTGRHRYASDLEAPGMLYGRVLRPAGYDARLVSLDSSKAAAMAGVRVVRDGDFVGVAAPDSTTAEAALAAIDARWEVPAQPSRAEIFDYFKANPVASAGWRGSRPHVQGSIEAGFEAADEVLRHTYHIHYIAHVPLEPRAALARWDGDRLTVWTGTQRPFGVRGELADAFHLPEEKVRVIMPDTGSAYGGKHTGEAAVEAARLSKAAAGRPVKVVWTRQEEFTWAYLRPGGVIEVGSGATRDGKLTAWEFHNYNSGGAGIETPYEVANQHIEFHATRSPLPQGSYRGLAATANHFAREVQMDDMARRLGIEPLEFRRRNLRDARLIAVLEAAAEAFGWPRKARQGRGYGIAGGTEKGSYIATCAEVSVDRKQVRVERLTAAFECGAIVNPDHLRNQVEGALIQGLGGALFEAIDFAGGKILNPHLATYRVPRFSDTPAAVEVVLVDRKDLDSAGAGETPIMAVAPAVSNAILDATGVRRRTLPMVPDGLET